MSAISMLVWNRACHGGGAEPRQGDRHLAALLQFHGPAMNGGVMHAVGLCSRAQLRDARAGYAYLGLEDLVSIIAKAELILKNEENPGSFEQEIDAEYGALATDAELTARFIEKLEQEPNHFAPVQQERVRAPGASHQPERDSEP